jgi:hypothetical protein
MRFKKLVLAFGLGALLLIGANNIGLGQAFALAISRPVPPLPPPPPVSSQPAPCTEIVACETASTTLQVEQVDDGCNLGLAVGDDCSADVTKALTSNHSCYLLNAPGAVSEEVTYSIFCSY